VIEAKLQPHRGVLISDFLIQFGSPRAACNSAMQGLGHKGEEVPGTDGVKAYYIKSSISFHFDKGDSLEAVEVSKGSGICPTLLGVKILELPVEEALVAAEKLGPCLPREGGHSYVISSSDVGFWRPVLPLHPEPRLSFDDDVDYAEHLEEVELVNQDAALFKTVLHCCPIISPEMTTAYRSEPRYFLVFRTETVNSPAFSRSTSGSEPARSARG